MEAGVEHQGAQRQDRLSRGQMPDSQFVIGVDLGTTNSAVAYADLRELDASGTPRVRVFDVPQLVAEGEIAPRETLPSFLYLLGPEERRSDRLRVPWAPDAPHVAGVWARDQGALVPGRLVSSAKSWLCNDAVDRRAPLLPWGGEPGAAACSPVEASTAYLVHVRDAWNHLFAAGQSGAPRRFERQSVTLTVPASFDEEARELTIEAARAAGFEHLTMLEEPTAALYAWIASHRGRLTDFLRDGDRVLICDIGGGTTDFTLVTVALDEAGPVFERIAVGRHLLLGGDNLDLALTGLVLDRLGNPRLTARQQLALRRRCAAVKERLLGPPPVGHETVSVLGSGAAVVGGALSAEIGREDVLRLLLDGFLPVCAMDAAPESERRSGLRELGLPFASDPAVTRHLAAFLRSTAEPSTVRPDALLLNGGFFTPEEARTRLVEVVSGWFAGRPARAWAPRVLVNRSPAVAVAEGAAYSGLVRRGLGLRIGGGSPRACFLALGGAPARDDRHAVCVLPRGTREGTSHRLEGREFVVRTNRPLSFTLLSSLTSRAALGDVAALDAAAVHRHVPLVAELRFGKRSRDKEVRTLLEVTYTELGTLELWIVAPATGHRWRLQFQLRAAASPDGPTEDESGRPSALVDLEALTGALQLVRALFGAHDAGVLATPDTLMARLEETLGFAKGAWPLAAVRPMADALLEAVHGRGRSPRHEARWLNLLGYCLRPGFGAVLDDWRMTQARRLYLGGLAFPNDVQCQAEWLVLWQRVAGGLTPGQQREIFIRHAALLGAGAGKRPKRLPPQVAREGLRLLASLEHVSSQQRRALGQELLSRLRPDPRNASLLWALGRTGARVPLYGPLNTVVDPGTAAAWVRALLEVAPPSPEGAATIVQLAARTGDPARDLEEDFCRKVYGRLVAAGIGPHALVRLIEVQPPSELERVSAFGESLPEGLRLLEPVDQDG
jgi:hypothetical protein